MQFKSSGFSIRNMLIALTLSAFAVSTTALSAANGPKVVPGNGMKVKYGATIRVTVTNNSTRHIWLTPYGSTTLAPGWDIVSAYLTCLAPGASRTMDLYYPAATAINIAQVKFQAETGDSNCRNSAPGIWSEKCTKNEATLSITFEGNARRSNGFYFSSFRGC